MEGVNLISVKVLAPTDTLRLSGRTAALNKDLTFLYFIRHFLLIFQQDQRLCVVFSGYFILLLFSNLISSETRGVLFRK